MSWLESPLEQPTEESRAANALMLIIQQLSPLTPKYRYQVLDSARTWFDRDSPKVSMR